MTRHAARAPIADYIVTFSYVAVILAYAGYISAQFLEHATISPTTTFLGSALVFAGIALSKRLD